MAIANGINKKVAIKREATPGVLPSKAGAQTVRRETITMNIKTANISSNEIRDDHQIAVARNGSRKTEGNLNGELSPGTYADQFAALLRREFTAGATLTAAGISLTQDGFEGVDFVAAGFRAGQVVRATGFDNENMNANNFLVTEISSLAMNGIFVNGTDIVAEAPAGDVTFKVIGGVTNVPSTGHTDVTYAVEEFFSDVGVSNVYKGNKLGGADIDFKPDAMATVKFSMMGMGRVDSNARYFTDPIPAPTTQTLTGSSGVAWLLGKQNSLATGFSLKLDAGLDAPSVLCSREVPEIFRGPLKASGSLQVYYDGPDVERAALNELEVAVVAVFTTSDANDADFVLIHLPRVKLNDASKDDGSSGITQSVGFDALKLNGFTTIEMQDSLASV